MRGKWFIILIFSLALIMAGSGLVYRYTQTNEVMDFWGPENSQNISSPDQVTLCEMAPQSGGARSLPAADSIDVDGRPIAILKQKDVTKARGFINASGALILNRNYDWQPRRENPDCTPVWAHALIYRRGLKITVVPVSINCGWVYSQATDRVAGLNKSVIEGLAKLFREQLGS